MKVVVAGAGNTGRHLALDLSARGHDVTLIEQETAPAARARHDLPETVRVVLGDACEPYVLEEAKLGQADVIVAATGDDEDNLVVSLLAKQEFAVPRVLARVNHPTNEWMFTEQWGVDAAVSPPHILTALVEEAVTVGDVVRLLKLERGRVSLVELVLREGSEVAGKPMYELRLPLDSSIVAIIREGHVVIHQRETVLVPGDELPAIATPAAAPRRRARRPGGSRSTPGAPRPAGARRTRSGVRAIVGRTPRTRSQPRLALPRDGLGRGGLRSRRHLRVLLGLRVPDRDPQD